MVQRARVLNDHGFAVLLFDFQAHGDSLGSHITFGRLEAMDAAAAVRFVRDRLPTEKVGAIGVSLGGAAALLGPEPLPVDALVLESVYPDIDAALANRLRTGLGPVIGPLFTPLLSQYSNCYCRPYSACDRTNCGPSTGSGRRRLRSLLHPALPMTELRSLKRKPCSTPRPSLSASGRSRAQHMPIWSDTILATTGVSSCRS
jgi:pimeloyl-ACP methyl ester carboxylesterase